MRNELCLSYRKYLKSSATSSSPTLLSCLPTLQHLASSRLIFPPQSPPMPAHPIAQLLLWLAQSPHTGASETSLEIVHLSGHVCAPLPSVFWKKYGERRVENGEVRGAVTGKDSLDSLVPRGWGISQPSGAIRDWSPEQMSLSPGLQGCGTEPI